MEIAPDNLSDKAKFDLTLVEKAISGDQKAYADLMDRYRDAIYFMLLKMVNNKSDAEDLTLEAFGKAFKNIHQYTPNYAFSTWLFKIATNNCIDFIRKRKANTISIDQNVDDQEGSYIPPTAMLSSGSPDPEENLIKEQNIKLVQDVVSKSKPRYRKLIELRYFKEYSYEEIADELSFNLTTREAQLISSFLILLNIIKNLLTHH